MAYRFIPKKFLDISESEKEEDEEEEEKWDGTEEEFNIDDTRPNIIQAPDPPPNFLEIYDDNVDPNEYLSDSGIGTEHIFRFNKKNYDLYDPEHANQFKIDRKNLIDSLSIPTSENLNLFNSYNEAATRRFNEFKEKLPRKIMETIFENPDFAYTDVYRSDLVPYSIKKEYLFPRFYYKELKKLSKKVYTMEDDIYLNKLIEDYEKTPTPMRSFNFSTLRNPLLYDPANVNDQQSNFRLSRNEREYVLDLFGHLPPNEYRYDFYDRSADAYTFLRHGLTLWPQLPILMRNNNVNHSNLNKINRYILDRMREEHFDAPSSSTRDFYFAPFMQRFEALQNIDNSVQTPSNQPTIGSGLSAFEGLLTNEEKSEQSKELESALSVVSNQRSYHDESQHPTLKSIRDNATAFYLKHKKKIQDSNDTEESKKKQLDDLATLIKSNDPTKQQLFKESIYIEELSKGNSKLKGISDIEELAAQNLKLRRDFNHPIKLALGYPPSDEEEEKENTSRKNKKGKKRGRELTEEETERLQQLQERRGRNLAAQGRIERYTTNLEEWLEHSDQLTDLERREIRLTMEEQLRTNPAFRLEPWGDDDDEEYDALMNS